MNQFRQRLGGVALEVAHQDDALAISPIFGSQIGSGAPSGLCLVVDVAERLDVMVMKQAW